MKRWILAFIAFLTVSVTPFRHARSDGPAPTADLKITFVYDSNTNPDPVPIETGKNPWCSIGQTQRYYENLIVDSKTYGIKNVVLYPRLGSNLTLPDVDEDMLKRAKVPVVLKCENCIFTPHVISTIGGGSIVIENTDECGHLVHLNFFAGAAVGGLIPSGGKLKKEVTTSELAPIPIECNVHPWMRAYVIVTDTPFVGISDKDGEVVIKKLPANKHIKLKLWHESSKGAIEKVDLDGKIVHWKKGVIELNLKPGMNDLGVCKLTPEHFKD